MDDHDLSSGGDAFTAEEQAAFDAYAADDGVDAGTGGVEPPAGEASTVSAAPAAAAPAGEPAAPGEVVDPDAADADDAEANKGRFVRHGAFHQERERRKAEAARATAAEAALTELREKFARGDERLKLLSEAMQRPAATPAAAEPPKVIDPNEDIFGAYEQLKSEVEALRTSQTQLTEAQKAERAQAQEREEHASAMTSYASDAQRYMATEPAFADAYNHLIGSRVAELKLYGVDEATAMREVAAEEAGLVKAAIKAGKSPAEHIYKIAQARGFMPKAAEPAKPAAPAETQAERMARISAGQTAAKSLSAAGGAPASEVTMDMLASMSEAEFEKYATANPARVRALMGG
ncbi:hypothetical protein [Methylobacterium sp. Leaf466]|uniref:hypothetical protein n=1 Tax=Methylobacterium sp. Leaf466 TaxID=1736386 RepID=UPI0006F8EB1B|nr:hypothetical protein [Methylobacterium sp. Leaf466]KQT88924.1 hypothetical protein ASG59_13720 [Methylobacterium sp. Leaf466]